MVISQEAEEQFSCCVSQQNTTHFLATLFSHIVLKVTDYTFQAFFELSVSVW